MAVQPSMKAWTLLNNKTVKRNSGCVFRRHTEMPTSQAVLSLLALCLGHRAFTPEPFGSREARYSLASLWIQPMHEWIFFLQGNDDSLGSRCNFALDYLTSRQALNAAA